MVILLLFTLVLLIAAPIVGGITVNPLQHSFKFFLMFLCIECTAFEYFVVQEYVDIFGGAHWRASFI